MAELIVYASWADVEEIRRFVNEDPEVAWIVKADQSGCNYKWRACLQVESIAEQDYAIWHMRSGPLNIPSGSPNKRDKVVTDPFRGWNQVLDGESHTAPWFGGNLPGPYSFRFRESGGEKAGALGRSGFNWLLDRYKSIGMPAHPEAKRLVAAAQAISETECNGHTLAKPLWARNSLCVSGCPEASEEWAPSRRESVSDTMLPLNKPLVPTRNGEAPLLAAQRRR
jgi:hypothetical protein